MDDDQLEHLLFPEVAKVRSTYPQPDYEAIKKELTTKGVTLQLLWFEYRELHPDGYGYSQFCQRYRDWRRRRDVKMLSINPVQTSVNAGGVQDLRSS